MRYTIAREFAVMSEMAMLQAMDDRAGERAEKYTIVGVERFPRLTEMQETIMIGSFSWLGMKSKTRWMHKPTWLVTGLHVSTPSDVARDYIAIKYGRKRRVTTAQYQKIITKRHHPLYADPIKLDEAVYIDLKAAYWSILNVIGWDVDYFPGKWLARGLDMSDFPFYGNKLARNCLITAGIGASPRIWKYPEMVLTIGKKVNSSPNYVLWAAVQDILNGIAFDMINAGAVYVHTDGYIVPSIDVPKAVDALEKWGLPWGIKHHGKCRVYGPGCYDIASRTHKNRTVGEREISSFYVPEAHEWLRSSFAKLSEGRNG